MALPELLETFAKAAKAQAALQLLWHGADNRLLVDTLAAIEALPAHSKRKTTTEKPAFKVRQTYIYHNETPQLFVEIRQEDGISARRDFKFSVNLGDKPNTLEFSFADPHRVYDDALRAHLAVMAFVGDDPKNGGHYVAALREALKHADAKPARKRHPQ